MYQLQANGDLDVSSPLEKNTSTCQDTHDVSTSQPEQESARCQGHSGKKTPLGVENMFEHNSKVGYTGIYDYILYVYYISYLYMFTL